jgi:lactoylglutathione lyase
MSFVHTTFMVKNMGESLQFYQDIVGLEISRRFSTGTGEIVFLGSGETKVELIYNDGLKDIGYTENISLGFSVNSLDEKMKFVQEKGIKIHSGPIQAGPGTRFFYVLDPNGLKIQFIETAHG